MGATLRSMFLVLCLCFAQLACGAAPVKAPTDVLGQLEWAEIEHSSAQARAQASADAAKLQQREAEAAKAAEVRAAQAHAASLDQAAKLRDAQAEEFHSKARAHREKMCKIDPGRCASPSPRADSAQQPPPPPPARADFVDVVIASFSAGGFSHGVYPDGWRIKYVPSKFILVIDGQDKKELAEDASAIGGCFRVSESGFSRMDCPK
jgi:hypothetical protein